MRQLILMRHAKTEQAASGQSDFSRALTERGRIDAPLVAARLVEAGANPTLALVSDAARAQQTWRLIQETFPSCKHRTMSTLYLAEAEAIIREALQTGEDRILIVGHNPGIHELACVMAGNESPAERELQQKLPTSAAAYFERNNATAPWRLRSFLQPKELRA